MAKRVDLSIIVLNYNTRKLLQQCLNSVQRADFAGFSFEVIVVDNASTDGSPKMVKKEFPEIKLIETKKNLGFAAGNNLGIPKSSGKYILFLNPDTILSQDTLLVMYRYMKKNPEVGAATCRVELKDGSLDEASHRGFPTPWRAFCHFLGLEKLFSKSRLFAGYILGHLSLNMIHEIDSGTGAFLFVRRKAGEEIKWWDEDYFWYGEDLDFCYRLKEKGWKIMFVPETKIIHFRGMASGIKKHTQKISSATSETRRMAVRASIEAMRIFYRKHYLGKYPKVVTWLTFLGINLLEKVRFLRVK